jgi:hypothetical protein
VVVTRRRLLGAAAAGTALAAAGCGSGSGSGEDDDGATLAALAADARASAEALAAAQRATRGAHGRALARQWEAERRRAAALAVAAERAGARPARDRPVDPRGGLEGALAAAERAVAGELAALPRLGERSRRALVASGLATSAEQAATLRSLLGRAPARDAFEYGARA